MVTNGAVGVVLLEEVDPGATAVLLEVVVLVKIGVVVMDIIVVTGPVVTIVVVDKVVFMLWVQLEVTTPLLV